MRRFGKARDRQRPAALPRLRIGRLPRASGAARRALPTRSSRPCPEPVCDRLAQTRSRGVSRARVEIVDAGLAGARRAFASARYSGSL
jgi:hypothetical protein